MNFSRKMLFLVGAVAALLFVGKSSAQTLPPLKQALEQEGNRAVYTRVTNAKQGGPIFVSARLQVSQRAYGSGLLYLKNVSPKAVVALRGVWEINLGNGEVRRNGWYFGGPGLYAKGGLAAGADATLPVSGPPNYTADDSTHIERVSLRITGVVYRDGSHWGEEAENVLSKLQTDKKNMLTAAEKIRAACLNSSTQIVIDQLNSGKPTELIPDTPYRLFFRNVFFDKSGAARPEAMQLLDNLIANLRT